MREQDADGGASFDALTIRQLSLNLKEEVKELLQPTKGKAQSHPKPQKSFLEKVAILCSRIVSEPTDPDIAHKLAQLENGQRRMLDDLTLIKTHTRSHMPRAAPLAPPKKTTDPDTRTYAEAARLCGLAPPSNGPDKTRRNESPTLIPGITTPKERSITIKFRNNQERRTTANTNNTILVDNVNRVLKNHNNPAIRDIKIQAVMKLPSQDLRIIAETVDEMERLRHHHTEWTRVLGDTYAVIPTFGMRMDHVPTKGLDLDTEGGRESFIRKLISLNQLDVGAITYATWLSPANKAKRTTSLRIEFARPEVANRFSFNGMLYDGMLLHLVRFVKERRPKQCFRCYTYGHLEQQCPAPSRSCSFCTARGHAPKDCPVAGDKAQWKCCVCHGPHRATSDDCSIRKETRKAAEAAAAQADPLWPVAHSSSSASESAASSSASSSTNSQAGTSESSRTTAPDTQMSKTRPPRAPRSTSTRKRTRIPSLDASRKTSRTDPTPDGATLLEEGIVLEDDESTDNMDDEITIGPSQTRSGRSIKLTEKAAEAMAERGRPTNGSQPNHEPEHEDTGPPATTPDQTTQLDSDGDTPISDAHA